jgi:hypothetical protein
MQNGNQGFGGTRWRSLAVAAVAMVGALWSSVALATITQGDFSVFGFVESREAGHWGEGSSSINSTPTRFVKVTPSTTFASPGRSFGITGGSFDFNHWDLVEMRQLADIRPDYHMVKNYKLLGRFDTLLIKDADFFAYYRPWYDAFGSIKNNGRQRPFTDVIKYSSQGGRALQDEYFKNDLREYYAQLNFTDNFSARIGKQQVIWSEADALSGTEVTNPVNASWHGVYGAESAEDVRTNIRMVKLNYILPDFLQTANNEAEGFWIPGDFQGDGIKVQVDPRNPWVVPAALGGGCNLNPAGIVGGAQVGCGPGDTPFPLSINQAGQQLNVNQLPNSDDKAMIFLPIGPIVHGRQTGKFFDVILQSLSKTPSNSIENSEFGARYSSLLPIGNGLQSSFIFLYEFRDPRSQTCFWCAPAVTGLPGSFAVAPGVFVTPNHFTHRVHRGVPVGGSVSIVSTNDIVRNKFFGLTGTYYDKDLTDIVYRYDFLYQPDHAVAAPAAVFRHGVSVPTRYPGGTAWTELTRFIVAGDRPTYIPWLSKQHTFLTAQYTATWYPDRPIDAQSIAVPGLPGVGKLREISNLGFLAATNWLLNGQLTATNVFLWDIDDDTGAITSTNVYRYSRNVLFGVNAQWFLGKSGRYTDPYLFSREQRFNELEFTFTYEI